MMRHPLIALTLSLALAAAARAADAPKPAAPPAPAAARDAAVRRFDQSATGKPLLAKVRDAEARRDQVRDSGSDPDRTDAARAVLDARSAYRAALQAALDADPDLKRAAAAAAAEAKAKPADPADNPAPMNAAILAFAREHVGQQVGNGECWTLADRALNVAGAKAPDAYVWGRPLDNGEAVIPGDVIQFTSARLQINGVPVVFGAPQHTSIVERVVSPSVLQVLHQNVGGKTVTRMTIDISTKTAGDLIVYRPLPGAGYKG